MTRRGLFAMLGLIPAWAKAKCLPFPAMAGGCRMVLENCTLGPDDAWVQCDSGRGPLRITYMRRRVQIAKMSDDSNPVTVVAEGWAGQPSKPLERYGERMLLDGRHPFYRSIVYQSAIE